MIRIELQNIYKTYRGRTVLKADLQLQEGFLYTIIGPNGSGKSTLLKVLALLESTEQGKVTYYDDHQPLIKDLALKRKIVLVPDRKGLFNDTVKENVLFGLKLRNVSKKESFRRVEESLKTVDLWELRKANALNLSTGESQRLCLAMALVTRPDILLLDEPTSSLDPPNAMIVEELIQNLKKQVKMIILVTHNIFQAKRLADRVLFLYQGQLLENASKESFFRCPATEPAKKFVQGEIY